MATTAAFYEKRKPLNVERFHSVFSKQRTTAYHDTTNPPGKTVGGAHFLRTIAWSPLGNLIATGSGDRKLRVWNPERAHVKNSTELRGHSGSIERVAWNPVREAELASVSVDGTVRIWDVRSKTNVAEIKTPGKECFTLAWKPDGTEMVAGSKDNTLIRISRLSNGEISRHQQPIQTNQACFSWSGHELLLTSGNGSIRVLDYPSMEAIHSFKAHTSSSSCLEMSPCGKRLAVGGTDSLITLWDTTRFYCQRALGKMNGPVRTLSYSWCGGYLVGGSEQDRGLHIIHVASGEYVHTVSCGPAPIVQWSPRDYSLAYAVYEGGTAGLRIVNGANLV